MAVYGEPVGINDWCRPVVLRGYDVTGDRDRAFITIVTSRPFLRWRVS
jgi:signal transduction protein with GAF and PtsI domain